MYPLKCEEAVTDERILAALPSRRVLRVDREDGVQLARPDELAERADGAARVGGRQEQRSRGAPLEGGLGGGRDGRVAPECMGGQFRIWRMLMG